MTALQAAAHWHNNLDRQRPKTAAPTTNNTATNYAHLAPTKTKTSRSRKKLSNALELDKLAPPLAGVFGQTITKKSALTAQAEVLYDAYNNAKTQLDQTLAALRDTAAAKRDLERRATGAEALVQALKKALLVREAENAELKSMLAQIDADRVIFDEQPGPSKEIELAMHAMAGELAALSTKAVPGMVDELAALKATAGALNDSAVPGMQREVAAMRQAITALPEMILAPPPVEEVTEVVEEAAAEEEGAVGGVQEEKAAAELGGDEPSAGTPATVDAVVRQVMDEIFESVLGAAAGDDGAGSSAAEVGEPADEIVRRMVQEILRSVVASAGQGGAGEPVTEATAEVAIPAAVSAVAAAAISNVLREYSPAEAAPTAEAAKPAEEAAAADEEPQTPPVAEAAPTAEAAKPAEEAAAADEEPQTPPAAADGESTSQQLEPAAPEAAPASADATDAPAEAAPA